MYYKKLKINGVEYPLAVNISGVGAPTIDTQASVGMLYMDETNGEVWKLTPEGWVSTEVEIAQGIGKSLTAVMSQKAVTDELDTLKNRVKYIEGTTLSTIIDDTTAYKKSVPVGVAPYAAIEKIGGMTYRKVLDEGNLYPYPYKLEWSSSTVDKDGVWSCKNPYDELDRFDIATSAVTLPSGTYICDVGNDGAVESIEVRTSGVSIERISNTKARIIASSSWTFSGVDIYVYALQTATCYPMLYLEGNPITWQPRGKAELRHAKVKAVDSKSKNLFNLIGWSAKADAVVLSNAFGTAISSLEGNSITVSQSNYPVTENPATYENGFFMFFPDKHLVNGKDYKISFDLKITNNPLDISYVHIVSNDYWNGDTRIDISKTNAVQRCSGIITYNINPSFPNHCYFECRNCGISFEIGNVMITEADVEDIEYSPYGTIDTFAIPEAVQTREGFGLGIEGYPNTVEYANSRVKLDKRAKMGVVSKIAHVSWANYSNVEFYAFNMPSDYIGYKTDAFMLEGFNKKPSHSNWDSADFIGVATGLATEYEIWVGFPKGTTQTEAEAALLGKSFVYALKTPEIEDITDIMPIDNYIKVEGGGSIEAVNDYGYDVPSTIAYITKV